MPEGTFIPAGRIWTYISRKSASKCQQVLTLSWKPHCDHSHPRISMVTIHTDFAEQINIQHNMILVDAYSKWPQVFPMDHARTEETIRKLQQMFRRFGISEILVSDNSNAFTSTEFLDFYRAYEFQQCRSPPFHPQSNLQVERFVDTFKRVHLQLKRKVTTRKIIETFLKA